MKNFHFSLHLSPDVAGAAADFVAKGGVNNPYITASSLERVCEGDDLLEECLSTVFADCFRYAETVCKFQQIVKRGQLSNEDDARADIEEVRGRVHDATITSINILARTIKGRGKDNGWITKVSQCGRAGYGKFALLLAFELALKEE